MTAADAAAVSAAELLQPPAGMSVAELRTHRLLLLSMQAVFSDLISRVDAALPAENRTARPAAASATPTAAILIAEPSAAASAASAESAAPSSAVAAELLQQLPQFQPSASLLAGSATHPLNAATANAVLTAASSAAVRGTLNLSAGNAASVAA